MTPSEFLAALWGERPRGQVLLWTLPDKRSTWFTEWGKVDQWVSAQQGKDVYTGVAMAAADAKLTSRRRVSNADAAAIAGLWADIDVTDPVHRRANLPPTLELARGIIAEMPSSPTILVGSGHGLQAWWLFEQPWIFAGDTDRKQAQQLVSWWQGLMAARFQRLGYSMDSTIDLARVLRLPGTVNHKAAPVPVTVLEYAPLNRLDRAALLESMTPADPQTGRVFAMSADAEPPFEKFAAFIEAEPKFRRSWEHKRSDLADTTLSGYDQSLASMAAGIGWSDQEIVNLLIAHRRRNGGDLKLREDYYQRTLDTAHNGYANQQAQERIEETLASENSEDRAETLIDDLSTLLGVSIKRIVKYLGDPPVYTMETADGGIITLGKVDAIMSQVAFRRAVAATTGQVIAKCREPIWDKRAQAILAACEEVTDEELAHPAAEASSWLEMYLRDYIPLKDIDVAARRGSPFQRDELVYVTRLELRKWLDVILHIRIEDAPLARRLRQTGAVQQTITYQSNDGNRTSRSYYRINKTLIRINQ